MRYIRLSFQMIREKVLTELQNPNALQESVLKQRKQEASEAALHLAMAHEV
jgi:DNA-binding protein H-NS